MWTIKKLHTNIYTRYNKKRKGIKGERHVHTRIKEIC